MTGPKHDPEVAERLQLRALTQEGDRSARRLLRRLSAEVPSFPEEPEPPAMLTDVLDALGMPEGEARDRLGFSLANCDGLSLALLNDRVCAMRAELNAARKPVAALLGDGVRSVTSAGERLHIVTDDGIRVCLRVVVESAVKS